MISYDPMTKEQAEIERFSLAKEGYYPGFIEDSTDKISKSGNSMMEMQLRLYKEDGSSFSFTDYLVFNPKTMWKVVNCAESSGTIKEYNERKFCSEVVKNKKVKVWVGIQEGQLIPDEKLNGKPSGSKYPDKNVAKDYLKQDQELLGVKENETFSDDEIPF